MQEEEEHEEEEEEHEEAAEERGVTIQRARRKRSQKAKQVSSARVGILFSVPSSLCLTLFSSAY